MEDLLHRTVETFTEIIYVKDLVIGLETSRTLLVLPSENNYRVFQVVGTVF